jgi:hypothetical protein
MRPRTLAEVAEFTVRGESFDYCLASFLDGFYAAPKIDTLAKTPQLLASHSGELGCVQDAYLAATAEELSRAYLLPAPAWIEDESRKLHHLWFASQLASLRAVLLLESPPAFRSRNLFVSANALSRA